jgi:hypothetical protein
MMDTLSWDYNLYCTYYNESLPALVNKKAIFFSKRENNSFLQTDIIPINLF